MTTCAILNCDCQNFYTDWALGDRKGLCEDCRHEKWEHLRPDVSIVPTCRDIDCMCQNVYTDWQIGKRTGPCEDCAHEKKHHCRPEARISAIATKRQKYEEAVLQSQGVFPALPPVNGDNKFFQFAADYNTMLGRNPTAPALKIFMREENLQIARRLDSFMTSSNILFYLQGPPGVGKTKESLIWLLHHVVQESNDPNRCAWIPLTKSEAAGGICQVYLLERSVTNVAVSYSVYNTYNLPSDLETWGVKTVIFDNCNQGNRGIMDACLLVMGIKVIAVSSLAMKFDDSFSRHKAYAVNGWKETEYIEACKDGLFYDSVKAALQTGDFTEDELNDAAARNEVVAAKFHLAGGCARWMFQYTADELLAPDGSIESIENYVNSTEDEVITGFSGDRGSTKVNHLMSRIDGKAVIVSQYVANQLVIRHGESLLKKALALLGKSNPAMDGVLMEMDFMLRLGRSKIKRRVSIDLVVESGAEPVPLLDSGVNKHAFRLSTFDAVPFKVDDTDWLVPEIFNNGGFDCVQYCAGKLIFAQVTRSTTHSFNLKWYEKFRAAFIKKFPDQVLNGCEVWFIVDESLVGTFAPAKPAGKLVGFDKGTHKVVGMRRITA